MDKKIISILFLLIIVISATIAFISFKQSESSEGQQTYPAQEDVTDEEISNEIDDSFLSEDDEVEIGYMI